jgi:hypothetical protein
MKVSQRYRATFALRLNPIARSDWIVIQLEPIRPRLRSDLLDLDIRDGEPGHVEISL